MMITDVFLLVKVFSFDNTDLQITLANILTVLEDGVNIAVFHRWKTRDRDTNRHVLTRESKKRPNMVKRNSGDQTAMAGGNRPFWPNCSKTALVPTKTSQRPTA